MHQYRWTCLTTLILAAVIAPVTTVRAKTLSSPVRAASDRYVPLSPQSLPTITPLTVTELETDAAIPAVSQPVPAVSKLPVIAPLAGKSQVSTLHRHHKIARAGNAPTKKLQPQTPVTKLRSIAPIFNPNTRVTEPIVSTATPIDSAAVPVNSVIPLPQITARTSKPQAVGSFTSQAASAPILVVRSNDSQMSQAEALPTKVITNTATVQAEIVPIPQPQGTEFGQTNATETPTAIATASDRSETILVPQVAPIVSQVADSRSEQLRRRVDVPSFEAGLPVFIFDSERPQQIVATTIAQVGNTIVAPEQSIAIPVERPKKSTTPTQLPVTAPTVMQPQGTGKVDIEQPAATVQPALDKIVATQTGKASWYGFEGGSKTANGERYNPNGLTAAHRTLPFGTKVRVTSIKTGKTVIVRINDRGPFHRSRMIDVSAGAAEVIGIKNDGIAEVRIEILASQG